MNKKITIFTSDRVNIQDVIDSIENLIEEIEKYNEISVSWDIYTPETNYFSQEEFLISVHRDDVVIVDATIPEELTEETITIYPILTAQINSLDHVLVFSKKQDEKGYEILPLNVSPLRQRKNEELLSWLSVQLKEILLTTKCPYERLPINTLAELSAKRDEMEQMIIKSLEERKKRTANRDATKVMISYRNSFSKEIEKFSKSFYPGYEVEYTVLPPGSLCGDYEAHTPMRRWMLVGLLEDTIRDVDEVWVYKTENYTYSWWTLAEMVMVANINASRKDNLIKIKVYDPKTQKLYVDAEQTSDIELKTFINAVHVTLSRDQVKQLARYLSNTRPDTMGPEVMQQKEQMQTMASLLKHTPSFLKKKMLDRIENVIKQSIPATLSVEEQQQMLDEMMKMYRDPNEFEAYLNDDVFKDEFWNIISYQTDEKTQAFKDDHIDVDSFMRIPMDELTQYAEETFVNSKEKKVTIIREGKEYNYRKEIGKKRYLWLATRMGQPTIKDAPGLEVIQTYDLHDMNE